ncbi:queuosine precursor transporter [Hyphomonas sp.]|uniref:queuosine precursor transporter n=1 Tax=Hyphomonas sp. TaxID=87 RepID=UPI0025C17F1D|nr:queuosine precursor transporter [Hyphomonas sp.]
MNGTGSTLFTFIVGIFVATIIISNILAQKLFQLGPFAFTAGILVFPIAYIAGDIITEIWGYKVARKVIWAGFVSGALFSLFALVAIALPPAAGWPNQQAFETVLTQVPRVVLASLLGYLVGEFANSYVISRLKIATKGKHLWLRINASTVVGQAFDTIVFAVVAFAGVIPTALLIQIAIAGYAFKVLYELAATPITYIIIGWVKRIEGVDTYDDQDYSPFKI